MGDSSFGRTVPRLIISGMSGNRPGLQEAIESVDSKIFRSTSKKIFEQDRLTSNLNV